MCNKVWVTQGTEWLRQLKMAHHLLSSQLSPNTASEPFIYVGN